MTRPIPEGYHTITPSLTVKNAAQAIEWYKKALGAQEQHRFQGPDGKSIMHSELKIGSSIFFINDENPQMNSLSPQTIGKTPVGFYLYAENCDTVFNKAVSAGAKTIMPVADMFWGDRCGSFEDPYGHKWTIATHVKDPSPEEMKKGQEAFFAQTARK